MIFKLLFLLCPLKICSIFFLKNDLKTIESLSRYIISEFKDLLKQGYRSYVNRYENDYEFKMVGGKIYFCKFISKRKIKKNQ